VSRSDIMPGRFQEHREAQHRIDVVIHDQHPQVARARLARFSDWHYRLRCIGRRHRQPHDELTPLAHNTVSLDFSSVQFREALYQSQTDAQSAL